MLWRYAISELYARNDDNVTYFHIASSVTQKEMATYRH